MEKRFDSSDGNTENDDWIRVTESKNLKDGDMIDFDHKEKKIMLTKVGKNIYANDRICTHAYADLTTGILNEEEKSVTCPLHLSSFKLQDGVPQNLPAEEPLTVYKVKVQDGSIYVLIK